MPDYVYKSHMYLMGEYGVDIGPQNEAFDEAESVMPQRLDQLRNHQQKVVLEEK